MTTSCFYKFALQTFRFSFAKLVFRSPCSLHIQLFAPKEKLGKRKRQFTFYKDRLQKTTIRKFSWSNNHLLYFPRVGTIFPPLNSISHYILKKIRTGCVPHSHDPVSSFRSKKIRFFNNMS